MIYDYPQWHELGLAAPDYLSIDIYETLRKEGYLKKRPTDRPCTIRKPAHSPYVGVTLHRKRWIAQYGPRGQVKTKVYPLTDEGEREAAKERARALGLSAIPKRDGTWEALG